MPNEFAEQEEAAPSDITQSVVKEGSLATNPPHWLTKGIWGIGLASFLADVGHKVPTALFASLVTIQLQAPAAVLGLIEALADGLAGLARFAGGTLSDDPHRRRSVALGGYSYQIPMITACFLYAIALRSQLTVMQRHSV